MAEKPDAADECPTPETSEAPSGESDDVFEHTQDLFEQARQAVAALRASGVRRADGTVTPGNMINLRHGLRSAHLIEQADIAVWHREQVEAISHDLGGDEELTALARASVREVARLEVIVAALGNELLEGGVLTSKGRMRSATTVYLMVLDRFTRLSQALGLERRQRKVQSATDILKEHEGAK